MTSIDNKIEWAVIAQDEEDSGAIRIAMTEEAMAKNWGPTSDGIVCFPGGGDAADAPSNDPLPEVDPPSAILDSILAIAADDEAEVNVRCNGGHEYTLSVHINGHAE